HYDGFAMFERPTSGVRIAPSALLADLRAIRAGARFAWRPSTESGERRHNIIEGHLSFSIHVLPNGSVGGTILDANGTWSGVTSPIGMVGRDAIIDVALYHDGFSHIALQVGDAIVAERFDVPGPVRSVGALGITVGRWPDPSDQYTLQGAVFESFLYKFDILR